MKRALGILTASMVFLFMAVIPTLAQRGGGQSRGGGMSSGAGMGQGGGMSQGGSTRPDMQNRGSSDMGRSNQTSGMDRNKSGSQLNAKSPTDLLSQNTKLSSNLQSLLPEGTDVQQAASGFKNLGQFVAAVHVSKNLGIPFDDLKAKMATDSNLGKAIHELKPDADAKAEAKKAKQQANQDLNQSGS